MVMKCHILSDVQLSLLTKPQLQTDLLVGVDRERLGVKTSLILGRRCSLHVLESDHCSDLTRSFENESMLGDHSTSDFGLGDKKVCLDMEMMLDLPESLAVPDSLWHELRDL